MYEMQISLPLTMDLNAMIRNSLSSFVRMTALGRQLWFAHATWWKRAAEPARVPEQQTSNMERSFKSSREKESWMIESAGGSFGGE